MFPFQNAWLVLNCDIRLMHKALFYMQLEKHPDEYVEEDLRAVRDYEEKVKFLQSEREKYINMLYAEYYKLSNITRENMRKFNTRLAEASVMKLEVQTGISQQHLQVHRIRHNNHTKNLIAERIAYLELV